MKFDDITETKVNPEINLQGVSPTKMFRTEMVDHPKHYNQGNLEVVDAIVGLNLDFLVGNILKYTARYKYKGEPLEDLNKAKWYLNKIIELEEKKCGSYGSAVKFTREEKEEMKVKLLEEIDAL